jgi:hypothetical protein
MGNKKRNKEIRNRLEREQEMRDNPDLCFCDEPIYSKEPIGKTEKVFFSKFDFKEETPFSLPIHKCDKCGKKIVFNPPMA